MLQVFNLILPLFGLILLGFMGGKLSKQPIEALGWLNTFVIYFALPAMFYRLLSDTPIEQLGNWPFVFANLGVTLLVFVLTFFLGILNSRGSLSAATVQGLAGAYGNIGYMGPPIAILALGKAAAIPVAIIFCFENILHFVLAPTMMAIENPTRGGFFKTAFGILKKIILHPFILATIVGVAAAATHFTPPAPINQLIDYLARAAAPCALFSMGVTLALRPLNRVPFALGYIVPIKLVLHPVLMYVVLSWAGNFDQLWVYSAIILASLPIATNVYVIAQQYGVWVERASASILVSTLFSVLTVAGFLYLITTGTLPPDLFP